MARNLSGKVALVAGATRGAGRGIATMLGEAGVIVYCTGRSSREHARPKAPGASPFDLEGRPETIEETAERVTAGGGLGIAARVDHTDEAQVKALIERIDREQGRLDLVVSDVWGGDALTEWGTPFWEQSLEKGLAMIRQALFSHLITNRHAAPLLVRQRSGLMVEITDGDALYYRSTLFYDLVKTSVIRLAFAMAEELRAHKVAAVAVTPGFLRSEAMLEHFGVTEANWRDGAAKDPNFAHSESPAYVGRAVAALAADPDVLGKSGRAFSSWSLQKLYGFTDADGSVPDWGAHAANSAFGRQLAQSNRRFIEPFLEER